MNNYEDVGNQKYQKLKHTLVLKFKNNNFKFADKIFKNTANSFFDFNWIPSNIDYNKVFWKFVKINLILRMVVFANNSHDLISFIEMNLYELIDDMYEIEKQNFEVNPYHNRIDVNKINKNVIKKQVTIFYRNKDQDFWSCYTQVKSGRFNNNFIMNMAISLMNELKIRKSIINKDHSFALSCIFCICKKFFLWKKKKATIGHVWHLIPFLNYLFYRNFPRDDEILEDVHFLKYIPLVEYNFKDNVFDGINYITTAMSERLPYTAEKQIDPIVLMFKNSLPRKHIKKKDYAYIFSCYKSNEVVRHHFDSCVVNSIVGLYPNSDEYNHKIYKNISHIRLLLSFYNRFVFNPNKIIFIKMLCDNQVYFKLIMRDFIIFSLMNSSIPITIKYWESNSNINSKLCLNFENYVNCNKKNIYSFRKFYYFNHPIQDIQETTKKKKKLDLEIVILNDLKFSLQNDFIINKMFDVPIETYVTKLSQEVFNTIKIFIKYDHLKYHEKLEFIGLDKKDCQVIEEIEERYYTELNFRTKQYIEQLSQNGKFLCFNFFDFQSKYNKIKFYKLSKYERFYQMFLEAILGDEYFEKVVYTLCCKYPRICNKAGNQNSDKNESGLHEVSIGVNNKLYCCSNQHIKNKNQKNDGLILDLLKVRFINEIKKLFKYSNDRSLTYQLYQYIITKNPKLPEWFVNEPYDCFRDPELLKILEEEDIKYKNGTLTDSDVVMGDEIRNNALVNFCDFTHVGINSFQSFARKKCTLHMKKFSLPITHDRVKVKEILCKIITANKLQIKTIFNKRLKFLMRTYVTDTSTLTKNLIGQFIIIESKKKSKKRHKKKITEKKNNIYQRVFRLCGNCGELKLYNPQTMSSNSYKCKDCFIPKVNIVNRNVVYMNTNSYIPLCE